VCTGERKLLHSSYKAVHHVRTYKDLQSAQCQLVAEPVRTSMYLKLTPILKSPTRQLCPLWFWCTIDISHQQLFFLLFNKVWYVQNGSRNLQQKKQESPAIADKPARRESVPKIAPIRRVYNVVADNTGLSSCV